MTKALITVAATLAALTVLGTAAGAAPDKKMTKAAAPMCPFCKMPLAAKKSAKMPIAIKMNGKTYYTCAPCKSKVMAMSKAPMSKMKM